ncbi:MAG TPA: ABC transporter substrate-binding protein [Gaiellaceae bacterium]|nr:ABC transporter substrate-binding protein [Gaiellaceae bacterium]
MRRVLALSVIAIVAAVATTAAVATHARPGGTAAGKPIVVGVATAQTGFLSAFDAPAVSGALVAVDDINKSGGVLGRQLKVVRADTKSNINLGAQAGLSVISKGADVMLVTLDFNYGGPAAREAQKAGLVAISIGASSPKFGVQGIGPLAYTIGSNGDVEAYAEAEWAYQKKNWRTAYLLLDDTTDANRTQCDSFATRFAELGGTVLGRDTFKNPDPSIAPQITRVKGLSKAPDVVVLCSYPPGGAVAVQQLRQQGIDAPIIGNDAFDGDYWYKKTVPALSNFWYNESSSIFGNDPDPKINAFWKKYTKATNGPPQVSFGAFGYSAVQALAVAIKRAGTTKGTAVAAQLNKFRNEPLLLATTFTPKLHIDTHRAGRMMEIQNGKHTVAAVVKVQKQPPLHFG